MKFTFEQLERRLKLKLGEDESLEFKPHFFLRKRKELEITYSKAWCARMNPVQIKNPRF